MCARFLKQLCYFDDSLPQGLCNQHAFFARHFDLPRKHLSSTYRKRCVLGAFPGSQHKEYDMGRDGWAKFIVYGHTHHYEIVPLQSLLQGNTVTNQIYINSGTWRPVHELARFHPGQKHFVGYHVMSYLAFFKGDERKGRAFESWTGALESSS
jgi:hypothetical protein